MIWLQASIPWDFTPPRKFRWINIAMEAVKYMLQLKRIYNRNPITFWQVLALPHLLGGGDAVLLAETGYAVNFNTPNRAFK